MGFNLGFKGLSQKSHVNWYLEQFYCKIHVNICTFQSSKSILKKIVGDFLFKVSPCFLCSDEVLKHREIFSSCGIVRSHMRLVNAVFTLSCTITTCNLVCLKQAWGQG